MIGLIVLGIGLAVILLLLFGDGKHTDQLDAVKTAGTIVLGTGGAAALWLAARRQRTGEIALNQKHADQEATDRAFAFQQLIAEQNRQHLERVAAATEHDAAERRLTDLYVKAVEQLGSDKAAVRQGGMYALERVAQDNVAQRQTIVEVFCAYLRAPFDAARVELVRGVPSRTAKPGVAHRMRPNPRVQQAGADEFLVELEVRLTAQRLLTKHLKKPDESAPENAVSVRFWPDMDIDLRGATLIGFDFRGCHIGTADFEGAKFVDAAVFDDAVFNGQSTFVQARFDFASFDGAAFLGRTWFFEWRFRGNASFDSVRFLGGASFAQCHFQAGTKFARAEFKDQSFVNGARVPESADFGGVDPTNIEGAEAFLPGTSPT
ncbi:pentapeptide repeat-containing protein [Amycolatopsis sp. NBRC 101858]|uniref:pentapeptide repeat-containing protein n=1 Tax=Amycolatopsis sp. NBRC 101858 TaxID=3032200 RepID=UPI00255719E3|nr:pentapeptide repeat-containing protein [Amycolatopsis sp. NBRC 101858]